MELEIGDFALELGTSQTEHRVVFLPLSPRRLPSLVFHFRMAAPAVVAATVVAFANVRLRRRLL